jgi:hypothetical protein
MIISCIEPHTDHIYYDMEYLFREVTYYLRLVITLSSAFHFGNFFVHVAVIKILHVVKQVFVINRHDHTLKF